MQGNLTITGYATGMPSGGISIGPLQIDIPAPVGEELSLLLTSGNNTILIPNGTTAIIFTPPVGNTVHLTLMGGSSDLGISLAPALPALICVAPGATQLILAATQSMTAATQIVFL